MNQSQTQSQMNDKKGAQKEIFYTPASPALITARKDISFFSFQTPVKLTIGFNGVL
jgi:hypothetical protein